MKQFSAACENNKTPILEVLQRLLREPATVLEIGSGTGQHAAFFSRMMPWLQWQPADLPENFASIDAWRDAGGGENCLPPRTLDLRECDWPSFTTDHVFTANTLHIVSWLLVCELLRGAARILPRGGLLLIYGPFNYDGAYTSDSNAAFDAWLRGRDAASGVRDFEAVCEQAVSRQLRLCDDIAMPANNRILVFEKQGARSSK